MRTVAIIPAAGSSNRMGLGARSKVLLDLVPGVKVIDLVLSALIGSKVIDEVILAVRADDREEFDQVLDKYQEEVAVSMIVGGNSRQESVANCLSTLSSSAQFVAVHDAARPFCSSAEVEKVVNVAWMQGAAILGRPVVSTLKRTDESHSILETVSRQDVWEAETPQVFEKSLLVAAHQRALFEGYQGTDESELVERLGKKVALVRSEQYNFKLTTPEDFKLARIVYEMGHLQKLS